MAGHWTDKFSFVGGVVRNKETAYLTLVGDDVAEQKIPQAIFVVWHKGQWLQGASKDWNAGGVAVARQPLEQLVAVGEWGEVLCLGSGDVHDEHVSGGKGGPVGRGPMRGVRRIGDSIYAVGMDRQAYRRRAPNDWVDIGPKRAGKSKDVTGFEAVDGFSEKEIYAVGWEGEIWKYDGKKWQSVNSPTNFVLVDVCCASDGSVYACGRLGTLIKGRGASWSVVDLGDFKEDIWSLASFQGRLYLATMYGVYTLEATGVEPVDMGSDQPESAYRLSAEDGVLWSIGAKDVMAFDGKTWTRID